MMTKHFPSQVFADEQAALAFVVEQGRTIEARVYQKRYPPINYGLVVPIVSEGPAWAIGTQFVKIDTTGVAKWLSGAANDIPFNMATRDVGTHDFHLLGSGWEWNLEEVNQAALLNVNLNDAKAMSATMSVETMLHDVAAVGSAEKGMTGFVNDATVSANDAAATGTMSSTFWSAKDVDKIMVDVNGGLGLVRTQSAELEYADTIALPPTAFRDLATRRLGQNDGMLTVLEFLRRNNVYTAETGQPLSIIPFRELETASPDGGGRMVAYRRDPDVLRFHLPMPRTVLPIHQKSIMSYETGVIARTGGVEIRLPKAMTYVDEITAPPA